MLFLPKAVGRRDNVQEAYRDRVPLPINKSNGLLESIHSRVLPTHTLHSVTLSSSKTTPTV